MSARGDMGGQAGTLLQTATHRGIEQLPGVQKLYWNTLIGLDADDLGCDCTLTTERTASDHPFDGSATRRRQPPLHQIAAQTTKS